MMPGMDPKMMKQAMKRMGISQEELDAQAVIIVLDGKQLVFDAPSVQKIVMQGEESFQLSGSYREETFAPDESVEESDVIAVAEQAGVDHEQARRALENTRGDIAAAIIQLTE
jgi:nascent polypeptide-associated complex subunit alpha